MFGLGKYTALSAVASGAVVYHAFATREQCAPSILRFYPSMQYLTSSKLSIAVMGNLAFALALCLYRLLTKLFLGALREAEVERINERISQAVMETCLAMTIFREEFNVSFVAMFATLTFVKVFHWLVQDRVDYIETTPSISAAQHFKTVSFMGLLLLVDSLFLQYTISETLQRGPSVLLLFAFEYVIQASMIVSTFLKYGFIGIDMLLEGRWESKGVYVFYLELITDMLHLFVYLMFFIIVFTFYGLPLHLVRDLYWTFRNFRQRVADFLRYRRVTANMNERFPDASPEDLARCDGTCIICREEMSPSTQNKKLQCGHVFHLPCLRSWLERQQNCPTCRANVLQADSRSDAPRRGEADAVARPVQGEEDVRGPAQAAVDRAPDQPAELPQRAPQPGTTAPPAVPTESPRPAGASPSAVQHHQDAAPRPSQGTVRRRHQAGESCNEASSSSCVSEHGPSPSIDNVQQHGSQPQPQSWHFYSAPMYSQWEWGASTPMGVFPGMMPMQYAGQQTAVPPQTEGAAAQRSMPAYMMPRMSVPMVPISMLIPPSAVAVPANSNATHEQHQAAAAAAAAATAALINPWSSGLSLMPPTMLTQQQAADAAQARAAAQQASAQAAAATAAAVASAAAAAALISSTSQAPSTAAQVLQSHINFLQSHMDHLEESSSHASAGSTSTAVNAAPAAADSGGAAAIVKGKEKVGESQMSCDPSQVSRFMPGSSGAGAEAPSTDSSGEGALENNEQTASESQSEANRDEQHGAHAEEGDGAAAKMRDLRLQRFQ